MSLNDLFDENKYNNGNNYYDPHQEINEALKNYYNQKNHEGIDIKIDGFTNCLELRESGEIVSTHWKELKDPIKKEAYKDWKFDWSKTQQKGYSIFELYVDGNPDVQGRVSLKVEENIVDLDIVESAPHNIGHNGKFKGVGGHLFAIACDYSYKNGCDGYVTFIAKSALIDHYHEALGAQLAMDRRMFIDEVAAHKLIDKYIK